MELSNLSIIISIALFSLIFMIYQNVSKQLNTKSYIATTYMYIFFAFLFIILINEQNLAPDLNQNIKFMALGFLAIILTIVLAFVSPQHQILKHLIWISLIGILAIVLKPVCDIAKEENILTKVLVTISIMFFIMTYLAYTKPLTYFDSWYPYLNTGLICVIISSLVNVIFSDLKRPTGFFNRDWMISIVSVLLFNGFLLYDTQKIIKEGKILDFICKGQDNLSCADYPVKSLDVILDMLNLFVNMTNVYSKK